MVLSDNPYFVKYMGGQWINFCLWVIALNSLFGCVQNNSICCLSSTFDFFLPKGINAGSHTQRDLGRVRGPFKSSIWISFYYLGLVENGPNIPKLGVPKSAEFICSGLCTKKRTFITYFLLNVLFS